MHKKTLLQWLSLLGVVGAVFYFLHVIFGAQNYPGYDPLAQAVSDLTAADAPSREIAAALSAIYGIFTTAGCMMLCAFYQERINKVFRIGIYLFTTMQWVSAVGYTLFPLSESGYAGTFQDSMHMVVTALVVVLSIASMILIGIGSMHGRVHRILGTITFTALGAMALGSVALAVVPPEYFGIAERVNVYSVVIYSAVLSVFTFRYKAASVEPGKAKYA